MNTLAGEATPGGRYTEAPEQGSFLGPPLPCALGTEKPVFFLKLKWHHQPWEPTHPPKRHLQLTLKLTTVGLYSFYSHSIRVQVPFQERLLQNSRTLFNPVSPTPSILSGKTKHAGNFFHLYKNGRHSVSSYMPSTVVSCAAFAQSPNQSATQLD